MMNSRLYYDIILFGILILGSIIVTKYLAYKRRTRPPTILGMPVLLSYYSEGAEISVIKSGQFASGINYNILLASNTGDIPGSTESSIIYKVSLPFATTIHLLGIPRKTAAIQINPTTRTGAMERVELEGDYSDAFDLFCDKGMQTDARYVLDPKAMLFTLKFCQSQNWEIVGHELYFVIASNMKPDDTDETDLFEDAQRFIEEIRPAIERPLTPKELKNLTPYGRDYRKDLKCPLCHESMVNEEVYFHCPKSHGVLLSGGQLRQLISGTLKPKIKYNNPLEHPHVLLCPACKSEMSQVNYLEGEMVIDSCTKCAYRWLDAGEYTQ